jgi:D-alanine--poly(phosphoribitol) ligase subunit 1
MTVLEKLREYASTDRVALINRDETLKYSELDRFSDIFALYLTERYPGDKTPVVIYGHKETLILPCIYGSLKAGRAYVPVDITVPEERVQQIIDDVSPKVFVDFYELNIETDAEVITQQKLKDFFAGNTELNVNVEDNCVKEDDLAYILFTSGSTGKPKGVPITCANIENLSRELMPWMETSEDGGVILNQISYSFDVSVVSLYMGVSRGMTLYTIDKDIQENMGELFNHLESSDCAIWVSTPSFAEICVPSARFNQSLLPKLEKFLFCGEILTHNLVDELFSRFPNTKVINTYGPTEATVLVTAVEVTKEMADDPLQIPIGYPLPEVTFRIVDVDGKSVPSGEQGELLIISDNVGPGYFKRPDLTEKAFFVDSETGKRGYHTGDICFERDGLYYYCGRMDNQIKIHGHRVEIEDIENNLAKCDNIVRAAVLPVYENEKITHLTAFVLLQKPDGLTSLKRAMKIKEELRETLPSYMIPRKILALDSFPLNTNGKVDKKELQKSL